MILQSSCCNYGERSQYILQNLVKLVLLVIFFCFQILPVRNKQFFLFTFVKWLWQEKSFTNFGIFNESSLIQEFTFGSYFTKFCSEFPIKILKKMRGSFIWTWSSRLDSSLLRVVITKCNQMIFLFKKNIYIYIYIVFF